MIGTNLFKKQLFFFLFSLVICFSLAYSTKANEANSDEVKIKKVLLGDTVRLTLNTDMSEEMLNLHWFKDGYEMDFSKKAYRKPNATPEDAGLYEVRFNFCTKVETKKILVVVMKDTNEVITQNNNKDNSEAVSGLNTSSANTNGYFLMPNEPNPFSDKTKIKFMLPIKTHVNLTIIDNYGKTIANLVNADMNFGYHEVEFYPNNYNISSGVYYYILTTPEFNDTKPMVIVK